MRPLFICALASALTVLPGCHGFPSGSNILPVRYAGGFRSFQRSPGTLRALQVNAKGLPVQEPLHGQVPPRHVPSDDRPAGHVLLVINDKDHGVQDPIDSGQQQCCFNQVTLVPDGTSSTNTSKGYFDSVFRDSVFTLSIATLNMADVLAKFRPLNRHRAHFDAKTMQHAMLALMDLAEFIAIASMMIGLLYFLHRSTRAMCMAAIWCDKRPCFRKHHPFATDPAQVNVRMVMQPHLEHARTIHSSRHDGLPDLTMRTHYAYADSTGPSMLGGAPSRRDGAYNDALQVMVMCLCAMPFLRGRALRSYLIAGTFVLAGYVCFNSIGMISIALAATLVASLGYSGRSLVARLNAAVLTSVVVLLWAMTHILLCLLGWCCELLWCAMSHLWHAMSCPLSTARICVAWLLFPRTMLRSLQRLQMTERVWSLLWSDRAFAEASRSFASTFSATYGVDTSSLASNPSDPASVSSTQCVVTILDLPFDILHHIANLVYCDNATQCFRDVRAMVDVRGASARARRASFVSPFREYTRHMHAEWMAFHHIVSLSRIRCCSPTHAVHAMWPDYDSDAELDSFHAANAPMPAMVLDSLSALVKPGSSRRAFRMRATRAACLDVNAWLHRELAASWTLYFIACACDHVERAYAVFARALAWLLSMRTYHWMLLSVLLLGRAGAADADGGSSSSRPPAFSGVANDYLVWTIAIGGWVAWKLTECAGFFETPAEARPPDHAAAVPALVAPTHDLHGAVTNQIAVDTAQAAYDAHFAAVDRVTELQADYDRRNRRVYGAIVSAVPSWLATTLHMSARNDGRAALEAIRLQFDATTANDIASAMSRLQASVVDPRAELSEADLRNQQTSMMVAHAQIQRAGGAPLPERMLCVIFDNALPDSYSQIRQATRRAGHAHLCCPFRRLSHLCPCGGRRPRPLWCECVRWFCASTAGSRPRRGSRSWSSRRPW